MLEITYKNRKFSNLEKAVFKAVADELREYYQKKIRPFTYVINKHRGKVFL